uniref:CHK kinase-like domain-containing protein n=1 Tax=viral metagenome TaxID=1070528 RepID=A0A6C0DQ33_9ZZZZ
MNIIIPLGGKGERFIKEGFSKPKPLINVLNKEMIFHVLDNLNTTEDDNIFIIYFKILDEFQFTDIIKNKYPEITLIPIHYQTSGAVETLWNGLNNISNVSNNKKCVLLDCDTFYTQDILSIVRNVDSNLVFYTKKYSEKPIYSYIRLDSNNKILEIKEKEKISCNANTGCYVFNDINQLNKYCKYILDNKITINGEPYTSCVISKMIESHNFIGYELDEKRVFSLGTPTELQNYIDKTFVFLFDLDGTLVNTDHIYFNVWKKILTNYNIELNQELFNTYIHGNSDDNVVKTLLPNCDTNQISELKDKLFIENIREIKIIDGAVDFLKRIKSIGYLCSIVTNCNKTVAKKIIDYCKITKYIDYTTVGSECLRPKPYPDPYLETIEKYNANNAKIIIFEDSKSGLLSARLSNVHCIVGITTNYNENELIVNGANIVMNDYIDFNLEQLLLYNKITPSNIKNYIRNSLNLNIKEIIIDENKLKGGYISDVISLKIITSDNTQIQCVLKLENKNETKLSVMAKKLGLYERENYFYDAISRYINISCPRFYGLIKDEKLTTIGILMENLNESGNYKLNLNLNQETIHVSLVIIDNLAKFHSKYWNKDIKHAFPELKKHNDPLFNPYWSNFINNNWQTFINNWSNILTENQLKMAENIKDNFKEIQESLSDKNLTIIHGDVKSPNIFYNLDNNYEPTFLDWQYIAIGKGVQDLIFFLIESFDIVNIKLFFPIFKNYYYRKLIENGVSNYSFNDYENDLINSICYFPFFVAIWFGTTPQDDLIDKNFPFFFIQKLFFFLGENSRHFFIK